METHDGAEGQRWSCSGGFKSGTLKSVDVEIVWNKYSVPFLLRRVLVEELGAQHLLHCTNDQLLLETAVHAVLLDSGFVRFGSDSGMSLAYTLPDILQNRGGSTMIIQGIGLRFETLEKYVRVYGSLTAGGGNACWVSLEALKVASLVEFVWASIVNVNDIVRGGLLETQEIHVLNFWKTIKDEIVLPLMLDLCAKAGLPSPPCLVSLPLELRTKILESLPGVDVAKVECVCKELRKLGNDDELWKHKVGQEFPSAQKWWKKYDVLERQRIKWKKVFHFSSIMAEERKVFLGTASRNLTKKRVEDFFWWKMEVATCKEGIDYQSMKTKRPLSRPNFRSVHVPPIVFLFGNFDLLILNQITSWRSTKRFDPFGFEPPNVEYDEDPNTCFHSFNLVAPNEPFLYS